MEKIHNQVEPIEVHTVLRSEMIEVDPLRLVQVGPDWFRLVEASSGLFRLVQVYSVRFSPVQAGSDWFRLIQTHPGWFSPVQVGSDWFRLVQTRSDWSRLVRAGSGWFRLVQSHSIPSRSQLTSQSLRAVSSLLPCGATKAGAQSLKCFPEMACSSSATEQ